jgi:putative FmdB family regulatory protein
MPIYEYECSKCGKVFEVFQRITEEPLTKCKFCEGRVNRLISQCSFHLKGTGWYVTDYKHGGATSSGNGGKTDGGKSDGSKEGKTEAKAEPAKSDSASGASGKEAPKTETHRTETHKADTHKTETSKTDTSGGTT